MSTNFSLLLYSWFWYVLSLRNFDYTSMWCFYYLCFFKLRENSLIIVRIRKWVKYWILFNPYYVELFKRWFGVGVKTKVEADEKRQSTATTYGVKWYVCSDFRVQVSNEFGIVWIYNWVENLLPEYVVVRYLAWTIICVWWSSEGRDSIAEYNFLHYQLWCDICVALGECLRVWLLLLDGLGLRLLQNNI